LSHAQYVGPYDPEGRQQRQLDRDGVHLVGPPKTDAGRRTLAIPAAPVDDLRGHLDAYAQPGTDCYGFTGHKGGPGTLAASTAPAPRSSCTASATPASSRPPLPARQEGTRRGHLTSAR
jgi:hypothetical protein